MGHQQDSQSMRKLKQDVLDIFAAFRLFTGSTERMSDLDNALLLPLCHLGVIQQVRVG
jgi:hypothetical protein